MNFTLDTLKGILSSKEPVRVILDTDAYNEVDDQFCIALCLRSPERVRLLSINAAPFITKAFPTPREGMIRSYEEIFHIGHLTDPAFSTPVYRGSEAFLSDRSTPVESEAVENIIRTVEESEEPTVILAIGAITNVASALIKCPTLAGKCGVIWLGGHAHHASDTREYNLYEDVLAAQVVFDSGIPLLQMPCRGVCTEFVTTVPELEYYLGGKNALCDYLVDNVRRALDGRFAASRIIWDVTAAATLLLPNAFEIVTLPTPIICKEGLYAHDAARHPYLYVRRVARDPVYGLLFEKLAQSPEGAV